MPRLSHLLRFLLVPFCLTLASPPAAAQTITSLEAFEGKESWPLLTPENVEFNQGRLGWVRSDYDFRVRFRSEEWNELEAVIDVFPSHFQGEPAHIIQWTTGDPDGTGSIDALWVDASDFRIYHRIYRVGGSSDEWAGTYAIQQHHPDGTIVINVTADGEVERYSSAVGTPRFDFATMGFLFGLMDLEEGKGYRILNIGGRTDPDPREVFIKVGPRIDMEDGAGDTRRVREVALINASETQLITFYVTEDAPFFQGWDFRIVESGRLVSRVRARGKPSTQPM